MPKKRPSCILEEIRLTYLIYIIKGERFFQNKFFYINKS